MLKRLKRQGFTLVELLVTIILLGIVAAIVIYNMTNVANTTKETDYERYIAAVKSAADVYATNNSEAFNDLYVSKSYIYITIGDLVREGLLDEELQNPYTNETVNFDEKIKANLDSTTGDIIFEYPLENENEETFLVTISDYVVWGESYDCMQGAGSYQLSLSDEAGDLIMLDSQETINKYNFKCSLPEGFDPKEAGNYEIKYSWITESGTRKEATRTLRVLPQVIPTFKTNYEYDFTQSPWFVPEYTGKNEDANCPAGWKCLTYTPYVEGADPESTTLKITKKGNNPATTEQNVTNGYISTYDTYRADDGDKTYTLKTIVVGHYDKNYSYEATGSERIRMKLMIPSSFITTPNPTVWTTNKTYQIKEPYSPIGVQMYEFKLLTNNEKPSNDLEVNKTNTFTKTSELTTKVINLLSGVCSNREITYSQIAFRAINKEGYVGDWTIVNANLTNNISTLVSSTSTGCTSPSSCCYKSGSSCYYTEKTMNLNYGGQKFVVLERYDTGEILAATEGVNQTAFSPSTLNNGRWTIDICDGVYVAKFSYASPSLQAIINKGTNYADTMLPKNYKNVISNKTWAIGTQQTSGQRLCNSSGNYCDYTYNAATNMGTSYTAYVGNLTSSMVSKYGNAVRDSRPYWTTDTYGYNTYAVISEKEDGSKGTHCGEGVNVWNAYFYAYVNGTKTTYYSGSNAYIKPLVQFRNVLYACSGNGTSSSPYVIAT